LYDILNDICNRIGLKADAKQIQEHEYYLDQPVDQQYSHESRSNSRRTSVTKSPPSQAKQLHAHDHSRSQEERRPEINHRWNSEHSYSPSKQSPDLSRQANSEHDHSPAKRSPKMGGHINPNETLDFDIGGTMTLRHGDDSENREFSNTMNSEVGEYHAAEHNGPQQSSS
jgi:hypothetical protein